MRSSKRKRIAGRTFCPTVNISFTQTRTLWPISVGFTPALLTEEPKSFSSGPTAPCTRRRAICYTSTATRSWASDLTPTALSSGQVGHSTPGQVAVSVSTTGTMAYAGARMQLGRLAWFDRDGNRLDTASPDLPPTRCIRATPCGLQTAAVSRSGNEGVV